MSELATSPAQDSTHAALSKTVVDAAKAPATETKVADAPKAETTNPAETKVPASSTETKSPEETKAPSAEKPIVPEKYDLKLPKDSVLDSSQLDKIALTAKARGLSNEKAQELLNEQSELASHYVQGQKDLIQKQVSVWADQVKNDQEIGGDGFKQNVELASRVVKRYATDSFKKTLEETGLGNHPELVRVFARIGKNMAPDQLVIPGSQTGKISRSIEERLYGGTSNKE